MNEFSAFAPGRTEIAGNHVDHQGGSVIAAALTLGIHGTGVVLSEPVVRVESEGFPAVRIALDEDLSPQADETGSSAAIVRGCMALLLDEAPWPCGVLLSISSEIKEGMGLSSSAAFELLVLNALALAWDVGEDARAPLDMARKAQRVEQRWFGKPCGLMDQCAIAFGGINLIDFADETSPKVTALQATPEDLGLAIVLVDSGVRHSGQAAQGEYASIPAHMAAVAQELGASRLCEVGKEQFAQLHAQLQERLGALPVLRAKHYFDEIELVNRRARALSKGDVQAFLEATAASSQSSLNQLQNVGAARPALDAARAALMSRGACRIHGGGFGGCIQAYVAAEEVAAYCERVEEKLGPGSCTVLELGKRGAWAQWR